MKKEKDVVKELSIRIGVSLLWVGTMLWAEIMSINSALILIGLAWIIWFFGD